MLVKSKKSHGKSWDYYWDYVAQTRLGRYITNIERDFILRCLSALREKPELILDAGAGSGRHVPLLSSFASWVIATEIESKLIQRISRVAPNVLPLLVSAASESFPVADRSVDCVICLEVPYIAEQNWFFAECKRVLKPEGIMIMNMTNRCSWKGVLAVFHPKRYRYGHAGYYQNSFRTIKNLLKEYGFAINSAIGLNWIPFKRDSNSPLVDFLATLENIIKLRNAVRWSPWVLLEARRETI